MRFLLAVVSFGLAFVCAAVGIGQRTIWLGPNSHQEQFEVDASESYTLVDASVLAYLPGGQTLIARGEGEIFTAYGRTSDMVAWLADTSYNHVVIDTVDDQDTIVSSVVEPTIVVEETVTDETTTETPADPAATEAPTDGTATEESTEDAAAEQSVGRNPAGSDLWIAEFSDTDSLIQTFNLPSDMSVLVASDGTNPAPADISAKWALDNSTPMAGPLMVAGGVFALIGVILYILGMRHLRRKRGPRRRGLPPLPVTEPLSLADIEEAEGKGVISASPKKTERRALLVLPLVLVSSLALSGCSPDVWPQAGEQTPSPTPSPTVITPEDQKAPVLLESQATRILGLISEDAAAADATLDSTLAGERLTGPVLQARSVNYTLRAAIAEYPSPAAVPANWTILLPQAADTWPRSFLAIYKDDANTTVPPVIMMVTQEDPWSNYKLAYAGEMEASAVVPGLAPADIGATLVNPDNQFLMVAPQDLGAMYSDIIENGENSEFAPIYDLSGDQFRGQLLAKRQENLDKFNQTAAGTGEMTFSSEAGAEAPVALATLDSGAIVAVTMNDIETPRATNPDAVIRLGENPVLTTLTGVTEAPTGFQTTYTSQLFFYVPAQGSNEQIRLLGYSSSILKSEVLP